MLEHILVDPVFGRSWKVVDEMTSIIDMLNEGIAP